MHIVASRTEGNSPTTARAIFAAFDPETRTMPIPPRPAAVAIATIVSCSLTSIVFFQACYAVAFLLSAETTWLIRHCCAICSVVFVIQ